MVPNPPANRIIWKRDVSPFAWDQGRVAGELLDDSVGLMHNLKCSADSVDVLEAGSRVHLDSHVAEQVAGWVLVSHTHAANAKPTTPVAYLDALLEPLPVVGTSEGMRAIGHVAVGALLLTAPSLPLGERGLHQLAGEVQPIGSHREHLELVAVATQCGGAKLGFDADSVRRAARVRRRQNLAVALVADHAGDALVGHWLRRALCGCEAAKAFMLLTVPGLVGQDLVDLLT